MRVSMELGILRFVEVNLTMPKRGQITRVCYRCLRTTKNPLNSVFMRVLLLTLGVAGYVCGGNQAPANYNQPLCYQGFWRVGIYFIFKYPLKYPHQGFLYLPFGYQMVLFGTK